MPKPFRWTKTDDADYLLEGDIDEHADVESLIKTLTASRVSLDVGGIRRVNSLGVRRWILLMRAMLGKDIELLRCPAVFVEQLSTIDGFLGSARVRSVLAPYSCASCGTSTERFLEVASLAGGVLPRGPACSSCGEPTEFDDLPERYLMLAR